MNTIQRSREILSFLETAQLSLSWEISFSLICVTRLLIHSRAKEIEANEPLSSRPPTPRHRHQIPSEWSRRWIWIIRRGALTRKILIIRLSRRPYVCSTLTTFEPVLKRELINSCKRRRDSLRNLQILRSFREERIISSFKIISNFAIPFPINNSSILSIFLRDRLLEDRFQPTTETKIR